MSIIKNFILKYDKTIVMAVLSLVPTIIVSLGLLPMLIESMTFNAYLNGERTDYIEFMKSFGFMQTFAIAFMIIVVVYNLIRRIAAKDIVEKTGPYINAMSASVALAMVIVASAAMFILNNSYENKNNTFLESKLVDIKKSIIDGKCVPANEAKAGYFADISGCGDMTPKWPGMLAFMKTGNYTSTTTKDGVATSVTAVKPNVVTYRGYLGNFCRNLADESNPLHKEFTAIEVHGISPLSDKFETSSCELYKNKGQIQFMFK